MKLLLDENLSDRILPQIVDLFPDSTHLKLVGLIKGDDQVIWDYAKGNGFVIASKDSDFHQLSLVRGHPPKFLYLRIGNCPTKKIVELLRSNFDQINAFGSDQAASILILPGGFI